MVKCTNAYFFYQFVLLILNLIGLNCQVENEYGSYGTDMAYKTQSRDIFKRLVGDNALLYTTDGTYSYMITGGAIPGTLTTIDFGASKYVLIREVNFI